MHKIFLLAEGILQNTDGTAVAKTEIEEPVMTPALGIEPDDFHLGRADVPHDRGYGKDC